MSGMQKDGLRRTLPLVFDHKAQIADQFFTSLFHHAPETRLHFSEEFGRQKAVFAMVVAKIVRSADRPDRLEQIARGLVASHRTYDITPGQLHAARLALGEALTLHLSDLMSGAELAYWTRVVDTLVLRMIELTD